MNAPPPGNIPPPPGAPPPPPFGVPPGYAPYTPYQPGQFGEIAGFGVRLGGYLLDGVLYGLLALPFIAVGIGLFGTSFDDCVTVGNQTTCASVDGGRIAAGLALMLAGVILVFVVYIRQLGLTGQTWGRKIVGIKVVLLGTGEPIGIGKAIGRTLFAGFISSQVFYLGYLWMLWDDNKQTWHDKIVGSNVFRI